MEYTNFVYFSKLLFKTNTFFVRNRYLFDSPSLINTKFYYKSFSKSIKVYFAYISVIIHFFVGNGSYRESENVIMRSNNKV